MPLPIIPPKRDIRTRWRIRWGRTVTYALLHVGAVAAFWHVTWPAILAASVAFLVSGLGVTIGYHRLAAHTSFKASRWLRYLLAAIGSTAFFGGVIDWVGHHRKHHGHTDEEGDPHSPNEGLFWSHIGWALVYHPFNPDDIAKDLVRDRGMLVLDRWSMVVAHLALVATFAAGELMTPSGISWLLWAGCFRAVVVLHTACLVNSLTHTVGYRNFETDDRSRNSRLLACLTMGEGFHNNHHAHPRSAAHGMLPHEFDLSYLVISFLERLGLVWDVVRIPPERIEPRKSRPCTNRQPSEV